MMSMLDLLAIGEKILKINIECFVKKEFSELIRMNPWMILYLSVNQVDLCHNYVCDPLT